MIIGIAYEKTQVPVQFGCAFRANVNYSHSPRICQGLKKRTDSDQVVFRWEYPHLHICQTILSVILYPGEPMMAAYHQLLHVVSLRPDLPFQRLELLVSDYWLKV